MTAWLSEGKFRFVKPDGANPELLDEEVDLMRRLADALEARIPADATDDERPSFVMQIIAEDEELTALATRLQTVTESHDGSVLRALAEAEEREREQAEQLRGPETP